MSFVSPHKLDQENGPIWAVHDSQNRRLFAIKIPKDTIYLFFMINWFIKGDGEPLLVLFLQNIFQRDLNAWYKVLELLSVVSIFSSTSKVTASSHFWMGHFSWSLSFIWCCLACKLRTWEICIDSNLQEFCFVTQSTWLFGRNANDPSFWKGKKCWRSHVFDFFFQCSFWFEKN